MMPDTSVVPKCMQAAGRSRRRAACELGRQQHALHDAGALGPQFLDSEWRVKARRVVPKKTTYPPA